MSGLSGDLLRWVLIGALLNGISLGIEQTSI